MLNLSSFCPTLFAKYIFPSPPPSPPGHLCPRFCLKDPSQRCIPFCERFGAEACLCSGAEECRLCCRAATSSLATPFCPRGFEWKGLSNTDQGGTTVFACYERAEVGVPHAKLVKVFDKSLVLKNINRLKFYPFRRGR